MHPWLWILVAAGAVAPSAVVILTAVWRRQRRTRLLREQFGPENTRAISSSHDRRHAEAELEARRRRTQELDLHELPQGSPGRCLQRWAAIQGRLLDDPGGALREADQLVETVLSERGYPSEDGDQLVDDISVEHPDLVGSYRDARSVYEKQRRGDATTDELRHATKDYRLVLFEFLGAGPGEIALSRT